MIILGIETSCDETAASVVRDGREILSNAVVSQIDIFAEYGGVIPEVAARSHLEAMMPVIDKALKDAKCGWEDIDAIAVTHAPGLLGSLLIGTLTARTLAILHDKPLYAVHHLKSHVYANWIAPARVLTEPVFSSAGLGFSSTSYAGAPREPSLRDEPLGHVRNIRVENPNQTFTHSQKTGSVTRAPEFPILALVVSGGHTQILYMKAHNQFEIVGTTHDDAVGECFDKVAKILGLPYPGGPSIARAAEGGVRDMASSSDTLKGARPSLRSSKDAMLPHPGDPLRYKLPHPKVAGLDFSFSGLKTAVLRAVQKEVGVPISYPSHKLKELLTEQQVADFAASFQKTAVEILLEKMQKALEQFPDVRSIVVAGGVSANEELRRCFVAGPGFSSEQFKHSFSRDGSLAPVVTGLAPSPSVVTSGSPRKVCFELPDEPKVFFPPPFLSGDNGAMVAAAAYYEIQSGVEPTDPYKLNIYPRISIEK